MTKGVIRLSHCRVACLQETNGVTIVRAAQLGRRAETGSPHPAAVHPQMCETCSAPRMTTITKITIPDEVLNELAELAAIPPGNWAMATARKVCF